MLLKPPYSNLTNYHSHTSFCDGKADVEDFIVEAIRRGFYSYGVSTHAPLPYHTHWSMDMEDTKSYIDRILELKKKYESDIEIYLGMEIDYLNESHNPGSEFFKSLPLDYRIGSVHLLEDKDGIIRDIDVKPDKFKLLVDESFEGDIKGVVSKYFEKKKKMILEGGFDFLGHCDKISLNASQYDADILNQDWYKKMIEDYFIFIAEMKMMIEINTKGFAGFGLLFPNENNFKYIKDLSIPVVVNSDAHLPENVNANRDVAFRLLLNNGVEEVMELHNGKWVKVPISDNWI